jgi:ATP-dependent Clp protease ATP-binding subunit ClpB
VELTIADPVRKELLRGATSNLSMGGRGIGSFIESAFVNPLARELFNREHLRGQRIHVTSLSRVEGIYRIGLA